MENKKKYIMPTILVIVVIIAIIEGIVIITSNTKALKTDSCIGTWVVVDNEENYLQILTLYQGGTGDYIDKNGGTGSITWKIEDNILNITYSTANPRGFTINGNEMTSLDGKVTYRKQ